MLRLQKFGLEFENEIHNILSKTKLQVLSEKEIVKKYSRINNGIDHLMYANNYIICIQTKWTKANPDLSKINHFIKCVDNISQIEKIKCIGIYLSKQKITSIANNAFEFENKKNLNHYLSINGEDKKTIINSLTKLLYENEIYLYDDETVIMLD